jgi:Na+-transporting NADH:ubiquinone oxidoreductase subunit A
MKPLELKKGYAPNISGKPTDHVFQAAQPDCIGLAPSRIPFIKPRLHIAEGDQVQIGSLIFTDKRDSRIKFLSPGAGRIQRIVFGKRRVIESIEIQLDAREASCPFPLCSRSDIERMSRQDVIDLLLNGGMWPFLRALPFRDIAPPDEIAPQIIVILGNRHPFCANPAIYLNQRTDLLALGLAALQKLTNGAVHVTADAYNTALPAIAGDMITHTLAGSYPADDPAVFVYHTRQDSHANKSWYIDGQDVLAIAELLTTGAYPIQRMVAVGGARAVTPQHAHTRMGAPLASIAATPSIQPDTRWIVGGVFTGQSAPADGYLGFYDTALNLLPIDREKEFMAFARGGHRKLSHSKTFLSRFNRQPLTADCNIHGELRACVNCAFCSQICPVDLLPQFIYKDILADDIDEALALGLLDCAECGLCTFVCPSKIDIGAVLQKAKFVYRLENQA